MFRGSYLRDYHKSTVRGVTDVAEKVLTVSTVIISLIVEIFNYIGYANNATYDILYLFSLIVLWKLHVNLLLQSFRSVSLDLHQY